MTTEPQGTHRTHTWRIKHQNDTYEDIKAFQLSFSDRDVAYFHGYDEDGRWTVLLSLAPPPTYREIRLVDDEVDDEFKKGLAEWEGELLAEAAQSASAAEAETKEAGQ